MSLYSVKLLACTFTENILLGTFLRLNLVSGDKGSSICGTPAKKSQNMLPGASKFPHQDSQVATYIDLKL